MTKINLAKRIKQKINKLSKKQCAVLIVSAILTLVVIGLIPALAWFTNQRKMAVISNINAPYTLYLSSGNEESVIYFDMDAVDVGVPGSRVTTHKDYVFSVQGSWDITDYYLQLAHTTNIPFKYTVYRVSNNDIYNEAGYSALSDTLKATTVPYTAHYDNGDVSKNQVIYYTYREDSVYTYSNAELQYGKVMDESNYVNPAGSQLAIKDASNTYYSQTYDSTGTGRVQKNAVPLYMQSGRIKKNADTPNGQDFCDYYVIRVDWKDAAQLKNDKETDMIYITVVSPSLVNAGD